MNRLLQGEVGSGKTLVALRAMLRTVDSGGQAALLAPTEVLAQQHHRSITAMLGDLAAGGMLGGAAEGTTVALLTGSMTKAQRQEAMLRIASGEAGIVIGTHALLEEKVTFADLGLVVVDEQHRFGVEQRAALTDKAGTPAARPGDDRDADPAHGRDDRLRRPRDLDAHRAARRPGPDPDQRRAPRPTSRTGSTGSGSGSARRSTRATRSTSSARGSPATSRSRASRPASTSTRRATPRRRRRPAAGRRRGARATSSPRGRWPGLRVAMLHGRLAPDEKDRTMRAFAAGDVDVLVVHHRHRGRRRRRQRHRDGAARRRPVRRLPAPPAARPGRPGRAARASACSSPAPRPAPRRASGWTRWPPPPTASS